MSVSSLIKEKRFTPTACILQKLTFRSKLFNESFLMTGKIEFFKNNFLKNDLLYRAFSYL